MRTGCHCARRDGSAGQIDARVGGRELPLEGYDQFCPVALGAEVFAERWTPLILRELLAGSHRFSELQRGLPRIPRALLAQRLGSLQRAGLIERRPNRARPVCHFVRWWTHWASGATNGRSSCDPTTWTPGC